MRADEERAPTNELFAAGIAFLAGLLIPVGVVGAVLLVRRRSASTSRTTSTMSTRAPTSPAAPAIPRDSLQHGPPPAVVETEQLPPAAKREEPPLSRPEEPPVTVPVEAAAAEWEGWEFCEVDWWRGYVKSQFFAIATTPGEADYVVRESPMFRWRGNGIPEATPASIAAHEQLIEKLRAEGWEDDPGPSLTWYSQKFRRRKDRGALSR